MRKGRKERIKKGSRERIEIERKETKENELTIRREGGTSTLASAKHFNTSQSTLTDTTLQNMTLGRARDPRAKGAWLNET